MISFTRRMTAGVLFILAIVLAAGSSGQEEPTAPSSPAAEREAVPASPSATPVSEASSDQPEVPPSDSPAPGSAAAPASSEAVANSATTDTSESENQPAESAQATGTESTTAALPASEAAPAASSATNAAAKSPTGDSNASQSSKRQGVVSSLTIFVLAIFVGFEVITKVPPTLHTPLMSGSNAISGITLVGAVIVAAALVEQLSPGANLFARGLGFLAVVLATINVVGGFVVTHRMLSMFKRK